MKKMLAMLLAFVMLLSLCACGNDDTATSTPGSSSQSTAESTGNSIGNTDNTTDNTDNTTGDTDDTTDNTDDTTDNTDDTADDTDDTTDNTGDTTDDTNDTTLNTQCSHSWKDATCSDPKTCTKCSATEGSAAGHSWKDATCSDPKTCTKCGVTEGNAAGHSWKDATCSDPKTCSKCGATEGNAAGHSFDGNTCAKCGATNGSYKQLTEGSWVCLTRDGEKERFHALTFHADGTLSKQWSQEWNTMEEFEAIIEGWKAANPQSWYLNLHQYTVFEVNGVPYVTRLRGENEDTYTPNGDEAILVDYRPRAEYAIFFNREDGDTMKVVFYDNTDGTDQFSTKNLEDGLVFEWCEYRVISSAYTYFMQK